MAATSVLRAGVSGIRALTGVVLGRGRSGSVTPALVTSQKAPRDPQPPPGHHFLHTGSVRGVLLGRGCPGSLTSALVTSQKHLSDLQALQGHRLLHTSAVTSKWDPEGGPRKWGQYNDVRHPPTPHGGKERHAYVCHVAKNLKYSPDKMWYVACLVRGLQIDQAIAQLRFVHKKGAALAIEALEEARRMALEEHYVEYPSNLWVAESFVGKGIVYRGMRRHARRRFGRVEYRHCHYFVTLEEGTPPRHYYPHRRHPTPEEAVEQYVEGLRKRNIPKAL